MKTIKEIAESYAQWILRREGALKSAQLPKVLEGMLKEQRKADTERAKEWLKEQLCTDDDEWYKQLDNFMFIDAFEKAMGE